MSNTTTTTPGDGVPIGELAETDRHRLLADERRRAVLQIVDDLGAEAALSTLAAELVAREGHLDTGDPEATRRVEITLHHAVLPKMDELGVLTYDPDARRVTVR